MYLKCFIIGELTDPQKQTEAENIQAAWSQDTYTPKLSELKTAAQLAQEGYLTSVKNMKIWRKDLSEISSDQLAKLVSIVTGKVSIERIYNPVSEVGTILASVESEELYLRFVKFSEENNLALVTAMKDRVQRVALDYVQNVEPELLSDYDGQGRCSWLQLKGDAAVRFNTRLRNRWVNYKGWTLTMDYTNMLEMERK